jgi:hypothetical protein
MNEERFDKTAPENASCMSRAKPGEPMFVLLGRDPVMSETVRAWCRDRSLAIIQGFRPNTEAEHEHVRLAMRLADAAEAYWKEFSAPSKQRDYEEFRRAKFVKLGSIAIDPATGQVSKFYSHDRMTKTAEEINQESNRFIHLLNGALPHCVNCGSAKIKLHSALNPATWVCDDCNNHFTYEPPLAAETSKEILKRQDKERTQSLEEKLQAEIDGGATK